MQVPNPTYLRGYLLCYLVNCETNCKSKDLKLLNLICKHYNFVSKFYRFRNSRTTRSSFMYFTRLTVIKITISDSIHWENDVKSIPDHFPGPWIYHIPCMVDFDSLNLLSNLILFPRLIVARNRKT